ncbi:MAG: acyl carrier protein [Clostridiales bacterium]|nr:MAG: acyl carrier protein [Clostridiales bacterium]
MMDLIREILKDIVGVEEITSETEFVGDLNLNSFDVVNMVCAFEERLGIEIPDRDIRKFIKVQDVTDYLEARGVTL